MQFKKQLLSIAIIIFITINASGQIEQGNWMVGGNGSFTSDKNQTTDYLTTNIQLSPNAGYLIINNIAIGLRGSYAYTRTSYNGSGINTNNFLFGPFARYYFLKPEKEVNIFVEGNYSHGTYKTSGAYTISNGRSSQYSFLFGGIIFLNNSVGIEIPIGFYSHKDISAKTNSTGVQFGIGFQIYVETEKNHNKHH